MVSCQIILFVAFAFVLCEISSYPQHHHHHELAQSYANFDQHIGHSEVQHHGSNGGGGEGHHGSNGGGADGGHHEAEGHDHEVDYHAHPKYKFSYSIKDPHTGDHKEAWESRDGDVVKGSYSFYEADGTKRVVEYTADKHNGFNAIVKNIGHPHHHEEHEHKEEEHHHGHGHGF